MIGRVIGGRFEIVRLIGQGGMGAVYEARHQTLPRKFAIKILKPELAREPTYLQRFRREAIAAGRIKHPNVIYITDFGTMEDDSHYIVMEYLEGKGLDEILSKQRRLPLNRALPILAQVADALDAAHQANVVHRDLKPENILMTTVRGQSDVVKLFDFGISKVSESEESGPIASLTMRGQVFGTAEYMSPEQATGEYCDGRSDIYAMGCLAYELLTGDPPFLGSAVSVLQAHVNKNPAPPSTRVHDHPVPPAYDALILRCLAKNPDDRYQSGAELRQDLLKVRGVLFSMGAELVNRPKITGQLRTVQRKELRTGWRSLGGHVPEFFVSGKDPSVSSYLDRFTGMNKAAAPLDQLLHDYHEGVRELALQLVRAAVASSETSKELERLLVVEEEIASLTGTIALAEQNFDRIRYEQGSREKQLRYAIFDLSMQRSKLEGEIAVKPELAQTMTQTIADLDFQVSALTKSLEEVEHERALEIDDLDREVKSYRKARQERQQESQTIYHQLNVQIEALKPSIESSHPEIQDLYKRLTELRQTIAASR